MSLIASNTSNTLTVLYVSGGYGSTPTWTAGDSYEIHKVLIAIDQPGRGKGDLLVGGYGQPPPSINSVTGTAAWPHQALEPCYAWNNKYNETTEMDFYLPTSLLPAAQTFLQEGRDFYNNSSSEAVVAKYTADLNGVDYVGTYTYPHPLVSEQPMRTLPTSTAQATAASAAANTPGSQRGFGVKSKKKADSGKSKKIPGNSDEMVNADLSAKAKF